MMKESKESATTDQHSNTTLPPSYSFSSSSSSSSSSLSSSSAPPSAIKSVTISSPNSSSNNYYHQFDDDDNNDDNGNYLKSEANYLFKWLLLTQILVYMEAGALPALLNMLKRDFSMTFMNEGALGGVVYLSLSLASPLAGYLLKNYSARLVLAISLFFNSCSTLLFALTPSGQILLLIASRCAIGATQAFLMVFAIPWVSEFAPLQKRTRWLSYLQGSVPTGIMLGYAIATFCTFLLSDSDEACSRYSCWRWPFYVQCILTFPLSLLCLFIPPQHVDIHASHIQQHSFFHSPASGTVSSDANEAELSRSLMFPNPILIDSSLVDGPSSDKESGSSDELTSPSNNRPRSISDIGLISQTNSNNNSSVLPSSFPPAASERSISTPITITSYSSSSSTSSFSSSSVSSSTNTIATTTTPPTDASASIPIPSSSRAPLLSNNTSSSTISHRRQRRYNSSTFSRSLCRLLTNGVFIGNVLAQAGLYWVVTGIQWWSTEYVITELHGNRHEVRVLYIITAATAPIIGVFTGGHIVDSQGGYDGVNQRMIALRTCTFFGLLSWICAFSASWVESIPVLFTLIWCNLFFGACALPASTGVMISSVDVELRHFASSFAILVFNLLGYFGSPICSAWLMTVTNSFRWGFLFTLWSSIFSVFWLLVAFYSSWIDCKNYRPIPMISSSKRSSINQSSNNNYGTGNAIN